MAYINSTNIEQKPTDRSRLPLRRPQGHGQEGIPQGLGEALAATGGADGGHGSLYEEFTTPAETRLAENTRNYRDTVLSVLN